MIRHMMKNVAERKGFQKIAWYFAQMRDLDIKSTRKRRYGIHNIFAKNIQTLYMISVLLQRKKLQVLNSFSVERHESSNLAKTKLFKFL